MVTAASWSMHSAPMHQQPHPDESRLLASHHPVSRSGRTCLTARLSQCCRCKHAGAASCQQSGQRWRVQGQIQDDCMAPGTAWHRAKQVRAHPLSLSLLNLDWAVRLRAARLLHCCPVCAAAILCDFHLCRPSLKGESLLLPHAGRLGSTEIMSHDQCLPCKSCC
jgi:hypothetical protein